MATTTMSRELAALCEQVAQWRQHGGGGRGKRVPEAVWQRAAEVARVVGVQQTSRATRLNYDRLKARVEKRRELRVRPARAARSSPRASQRLLRSSTASQPCKSEAPPARFVAVPMAPTVRSHAITIELLSRSGERMRIESAAAVDLAGVVQAFWSRTS